MYWRYFLNKFQFDFKFVIPHGVSLMLRLNVQTDMRLLLQQFLIPNCLQRLSSGDRSCCNKNLVSVCTLTQSITGTSRGFTNIKSNRFMSRSDCKYSEVYTYRLNQSKWTFSTKISGGGRCIFPRWANGLPGVNVVVSFSVNYIR